MKSQSALFILLAFLATALLSCSSMKEPDFRSIENIQFTTTGIGASALSADLTYFNPNNSKLKLKKAEGDAYIDGNLLGHFVIDSLIHIPANADFKLPVKLAIDMKYILKNSLAAYLNKEVMVKVEGKARVGKGFIFINYPIHYEGKQNLAELLR